jgi:SAM-dependent methyltransferase
MVATPVADDYVTVDRRDEPQAVFPLDVYQCQVCGHVQLLDVVSPDVLFRNYTYTTAVSLGLPEHFRRYAAVLMERMAIARGSLVAEIGSNDGTLLRAFQERGMRVIGVDPALEIAAKATSAGVPTVPTYFTPDVARQIRRDHGAAAAIAANNVFAHADDLGAVADGIRELLDDAGVFVFEVSYLVDIVEKQLFDTIYHEHVCYHSVTPLVGFFARHGLELIDIERIPTKGGSLRGTVQRLGGPRPVAPIVEDFVTLEARSGFDRPDAVKRLSKTLECTRRELLALVDGLRGDGKTIAGYGASATVTTLTYYFDLGGRLEYLVDDNAGKHGRYSPGFHLPVLPSAELYDRRPDYVIILAWAYAEPIMSRHQEFLRQGGHFLVPMPTPRVFAA